MPDTRSPSASFSTTASFRGLSTAAFTGALAAAAHAGAGGSGPHGGAAVLLAATAAVTGVAARANRASDIRGLATLLAGGQLAGHLALTTGHVPGQTTTPAPLMLLLHALAVALGAALVYSCERLASTLSRVIHHCVVAVHAPVQCRPTTSVVRDDQPLQHILLIASSISHRGPPGCACS